MAVAPLPLLLSPSPPPLSSHRFRHGRLAGAAASRVPSPRARAAARDPPLARLLRPRRVCGGGGGAEAGGWEEGRRRWWWELLRAVQRDVRPPRGAHRWEAEDARLRGAALPARHIRGERGRDGCALLSPLLSSAWLGFWFGVLGIGGRIRWLGVPGWCGICCGCCDRDGLGGWRWMLV